MATLTPPLNQNTPIVDERGRPAPFFTLLINQLLSSAAANALAIAEQASESVANLSEVEIIAGPGLEGGGALGGGDVEIAHAESPVTPGTYGSATKIPVLEVDEFGHVISAGEEDVQSLPTGGTTNQVLAKASNADYDVTWVDQSGGGGGGGSASPPTVVQQATAIGGSFAVTLPAPPTPGNLLVAVCTHWNALSNVNNAQNWSWIHDLPGITFDGVAAAARVAVVGDGAVLTPFLGGTGGQSTTIFEVSGALQAIPLNRFMVKEDAATPFPVSITAGADNTRIVGAIMRAGSNADFTPPASFTVLDDVTGTTASNGPRRTKVVTTVLNKGNAASGDIAFTGGNFAAVLIALVPFVVGGGGGDYALDRKITLTGVTSYVLEGLDFINYNYDIEVEVKRPSAGASSLVNLYLNFGDAAIPPNWWNSQDVFAGGYGSPQGGLNELRLARIENSGTQYILATMRLRSSRDAAALLGQYASGFWERGGTFDTGPVAGVFGAVRFVWSADTWDGSITVYKVKK